MKTCLFPLLLLALPLGAQNSFRIFDAQNNDVTSGVFTVSDTSTVSVQASFTVENTDSVTYDVTAGRLVISVPAGTSNAFSWGQINYPPNADSSVYAENLAPQQSSPLVADYFPNGQYGTATINYCVWDHFDMNNFSCVTVTYNILLGQEDAAGNPVSAQAYPNPVSSNENLQISWDRVPGEKVEVKLFSVNGTSLTFSFPAAEGRCELPLQELVPGMYFVEVKTENALLFHDKLVVE